MDSVPDNNFDDINNINYKDNTWRAGLSLVPNDMEGRVPR
jgi:hypothetical protein